MHGCGLAERVFGFGDEAVLMKEGRELGFGAAEPAQGPIGKCELVDEGTLFGAGGAEGGEVEGDESVVFGAVFGGQDGAADSGSEGLGFWFGAGRLSCVASIGLVLSESRHAYMGARR